MKHFNFLISTITFLVLISLFSCKPEEHELDSKVRKLIETSFKSKYSKKNIESISYDTIGNGDWSYSLVKLMINDSQVFSDKLLLDELLSDYQYFDTNDSRIRLIATINYNNSHFIDYIGIIGDSLTNIEDNPLEALLNICSVEEAKVLDIANVIGLTNRANINNTIKEELESLSKNPYRLNDNGNKLKYSKKQGIIYDKGKAKDTIIHLQFMGNGLNDCIDSIMKKQPKKSIVKDYSFDNYSCYHMKDKIEINENKYSIETQLYTINNRIVLIKAVCLDNIVDELLEMFRIKYGDDIFAYPIDHTFINTVSGANQYVWSFSNNCIILIDNNERYDKYYPDVTYQKPKIMNTYYHFKNATIAYCDKQMYRILLQKEKEREFAIQREQFVSDSLEQVDKYRKDSIQKAKEQERLKCNSSQI